MDGADATRAGRDDLMTTRSEPVDSSTSGELTVESLRPGRRVSVEQARGPQRPNRLDPRVLAFAAAILFAFAAWAPWVAGTFAYTFQGGQRSTFDFSLDSSYGLMLLLMRLRQGAQYVDLTTATQRYLFVWGGVTSIGVLLAPLLWQRATQQGRRLALAAFVAWLAAATLATLVLALTLLPFTPTLPPAAQIQITVPARGAGWGLVFTVVALAALWYAASALLREARAELGREDVAEASAEPVTRRHRLGGAALSVGILVWAVGFFAVPWATVNCPSLPLTVNHFTEGACGGLDSADALAYQVAQGVSARTWNIGAGIYPLYGILLGGALLLLAAIWLRPASRLVLGWASVWLLLATGAAFLAYRGVGFITTHPPALSAEASGAWNGATGVAVTLLGLLLAWAAILPLDGAKWWQVGGQSLAEASVGGAPAEGDDGFEVSRL